MLWHVRSCLRLDNEAQRLVRYLPGPDGTDPLDGTATNALSAVTSEQEEVKQ